MRGDNIYNGVSYLVYLMTCTKVIESHYMYRERKTL